MRFLLVSLTLFIMAFSVSAEEGMYPLSELNKLDLQKAGFELSVDAIFNPQQASLSDAIVKLGGCTGSFISPEGLILTNHHCAFYAVQSASSPENDYLQYGFNAGSRAGEIPAKGYTVRITQSFRDVSDEVLKGLDGIEDFAELNKAIKKRRKEITVQAEKDHPGLRAEVAEMFRGQTYVLFLYTYLKDVRMVYVPPISIGNFGGDVDNWEWPRHTGDFSIMRVYVGPDGQPAEYSKENIPYQPKSYLKVNPAGVEAGDFVFMLGYPGRTYRHRSSYFIDFEERIRMPFVVDWYQWQISLMEEMGREDRGLALKFSSTIKSLANTEKNYRGKLLGLKRLQKVQQKQTEESDILDFLKKDKSLQNKYGQVLPAIASLYTEKEATAMRDLILSYLTRSVSALSYANTLYRAAEERVKPDLERESAFMDRNFDRTKKYLFLRQQNFVAAADQQILLALLEKAAALPQDQRITELDALFKLAEPKTVWRKIVSSAYKNSRVMEADYLKTMLTKSLDEIRTSEDPILQWVVTLQPVLKAQKELNEQRAGKLARLSAQWAEVKRLYRPGTFIPDANGTFRLTYGHLRPYQSADAVTKLPQSTVQGILEKTGPEPPFNAPDKLLALIRNKDFGRLASKKLGTLPVGILYDCDTTGGNSGSPVMNAKGELIGLNFDRAFEATINDFAWAQSYSRSIGVDIRYILWVLQKYAGAGYLFDEMGLNIN